MARAHLHDEVAPPAVRELEGTLGLLAPRLSGGRKSTRERDGEKLPDVVAQNFPRIRRKLSINSEAIHGVPDLVDVDPLAPHQARAAQGSRAPRMANYTAAK